MIVRPGRQLIRAVFALATLLLTAFLWAPALWLSALMFLAIALATWFDARRAQATLNSLKITRTMPLVVGRDLPFTIKLALQNNAHTEIAAQMRDVRPDDCQPALETHDIIVPAGQLRDVTSTVRIPRRGRHSFGPVWLRLTGQWQLAEVQREFECSGDIRVLPEQFASREELQKELGAQALLLDKIVRARQVGVGTEFVGLDEYRIGDDPRRIDWRATARHRSPIVRRHQVERHRDVLILIDSGRLMGAMTERGSKLDCAVDSALNLARVALRSGDRCGIGVFDSALRGYLAPLAGAGALSRLTECAYDLRTNWQETDFTRMFAEVQRKQSKRCFLIVLSDLGDAETSRSHCAALAKLSRRHLVLFAALRTPQLRKAIQFEPKTILQGAEQVVAHGLLRDRSRALHALRHGGMQVLDVEPRSLTLPLINRFIEMRQRNQL
jgi:uncharacterized protein (DUF58 family)